MKNTTDKTILVPLISDGPNTGFKAVPNPDYIGPQPSPSPSYTLAELEQLAQRYTREYQMSIDDELGEFLQLSRFIAWLGKKEREARSE